MGIGDRGVSHSSNEKEISRMIVGEVVIGVTQRHRGGISYYTLTDPKPLVRCKDCEHSDHPLNDDTECYCLKFWRPIKGDDYCSFGVKAE